MEFLEKKSHMSNDYAVDSAGAVLFGFAPDNNAGIDSSPPVSTPPPLENWLQLYQKSIESSGATQEATRPVVQRPASYDRITTGVSAASLSVNGATAKVSKKRSRASRRAPTTLLSTDASNFRAMVQQFTGFPEPPFAPSQAAPLLGRSFPHVALGSPSTSLSFAHRPQPYPSFPLQSLLVHEDINVRGPEFFPRYPSQGQPPPGSLLLNDLGLNPPAAAAGGGFSSSIMLPSERRQGYLF